MKIPDSHLDLIQDDVKAYAVLATIMEDGAPQATPIWFSYDGTYFLINSVAGRVKDRNMRKNPRVALTILDPRNPYRWMQIQGIVIEVTEVGAVEHITQLSEKYRGQAYYKEGQTPEKRVIYQIKPERISASG